MANKARTLWLWIFVGCLGATALLGVMAMLMPRVPFEEELLISAMLLTGYSLLGLAASMAMARTRLRGAATASAAALGLSLCGWLVLVWFDRAIGWRPEELVAKTCGTLTIGGLLGLHWILISLATLRAFAGRWTRRATVALASGGALLACYMLWEVPAAQEEAVARLLGAMLIPAALGTIAVPVLARIERVTLRDAEDHAIGRHVPVRFRCPRCAAESEQPANRRFLCPGCGLRAMVEVEEPRCACGYLLHGLPEPVCPECGRQVPSEAWWGTSGRGERAGGGGSPGHDE